MHARAHRRSPSFRENRGSVLAIVLVTLLFATFALFSFMERASVDLLADQRETVARRLRTEAGSALDVTLGVLAEFREAGGGLRSPAAEGWDDPLSFAGYTPPEGVTIAVSFDDESGKLSLPRLDATTLTLLFAHWGAPHGEAEILADMLLGWMRRGHTYSTPVQPDYEYAPIPHAPPGRPLRSLRELAAIEKVRDFLHSPDGRPNDYWRRFADSVSLFDFPRPNLNGARPDVLAVLGRFDAAQTRGLVEFLHGASTPGSSRPGLFQNPTDAARIAGPSGDVGAFATTIAALRINITVRESHDEYRLSVVVAPPGGATIPRLPPSGPPANTNRATPIPTTASATATKPPTSDLRYPFTILEVLENDEIPAAPRDALLFSSAP